MDDYPANVPGQGNYGDPWVFQQVRTAIREGKYAWAETLLDGVRDHGAEWHFLMGALCFRKGWMDEAQRHYESAAQMDAGNEEYRRAAERMRNGPCYHPKERPFGTLFAENLCVGLGAAFVFCGVCGACGTCGFCAGTCYICSRGIDMMPH